MHVDAWLDAAGRAPAASRATPATRRFETLGAGCGDGVHAAPRGAGTRRGRDPRGADARPRGPLARRDRADAARRSTCRCPRATRRRPTAGRATAPRSAGCGASSRPSAAAIRGRPGERARDAGRRSPAPGRRRRRADAVDAADRGRDGRPRALGDVMDPELPMVSIVDLGMVGASTVGATDPGRRCSRRSSGARRSSSSAPPSRAARRPSGGRSRSTATFEPPWTSDRITPAGLAALAAAGIAPPAEPADDALPVLRVGRVVLDSLFGPTQCRSLFYCRDVPPAVRSHQAGLTVGAGDPDGRRRRRRHDGRRHRPGRPRGRPRGPPPRPRPGGARARRRARIRDGLARRAARPRPRRRRDRRLGRGPRSAACGRARARRPRRARPTSSSRRRSRTSRSSAAIFRALDARRAADGHPRDEHERAVGRRDRGGDGPAGARHRPALLQPGAGHAPRRGRRRPGDGPGRRRPGRRRSWSAGARRRSAPPTRRGSSSTASTGRSRSRRCGMLEAGDAGVAAIDRRDPRRRLPDGAVRADGPHRHRRQPRGRDRCIWEALGRPDRLRPSPIQERLVGTAGSGARPGRASIATTTRADAVAAGAGRATTRTSTPRRSRRGSSAIVDEAHRAVAEGVASEADIDLALRLGAGHPSGPFERAR